MSVLLWLEYRRLVNFIRYSIRSPKRLLVVLLVAAGITPNLLLLYHGGRSIPAAGASLDAAIGKDPALLQTVWLAAFLLSALLISAWPQSGLNSRFGQMSPPDRDFLLPAPIPGYAILIARALKLTAAWGFFVAWGMAYWLSAARSSQFLSRLGANEWSVIVPCLFAALGLSLAALAYSVREKPLCALFFTTAGWAGASVVVILMVVWGQEVVEALRLERQVFVVERLSASLWRFAAVPPLAVADAVAPRARPEGLPGQVGAALLAAASTACWAGVIRLTRTLWDPAIGMGRFQSTILALGGRSRSRITGAAISQPALRYMARFTLPFGNRPFRAIFARELLLAFRRVLPMYLLLVILAMLSLGAAAAVSPAGFRNARPEIRWAAIAFLPYICFFLLASHMAVARNRARSLDQDRNVPMQDRDRVAAQVLAPAFLYGGCISILAVAVFSFAGYPKGEWLWVYSAGVAALAVLGATIAHMAALLYPGPEAGEHFMSLFVMGPIALAAMLSVAIPTVIAGAAGGFGPVAAAACVSSTVLAFIVLTSAAARIAPDPTSTAEE